MKLKQLDMKTKSALQFIFCKECLLCLTMALFFFESCEKTESLKPTNKVTGSANANNLAATGKPNIILILGDDVGYEIPTVNGGQSYATPNIDRMAKSGMHFTQCHASPLAALPGLCY